MIIDLIKKLKSANHLNWNISESNKSEMEIQATPTYQQVLEENQRLWEENEKLKKKLDKCVCVGCGSSQAKYTKCGGEDGVNMCEECFT